MDNLYDALEKTYANIILGHSEPDAMFMSGKHVKYMAERRGGNPDLVQDVDGNKIIDGLVYMICHEGIIPLDEEGNRVRVL